MANTTLAKEIWVTTSNKVGTLAKVLAPAAEAKVNIWALCAWSDSTDDAATFMMITDNNAKALDVFKKAGFKTTEKEVAVTVLEDKPGTCWNAAQKLSQAGVNINYWYYTTCGGECPGRIVFSTNDNGKAVKVLG
ncbi:MAG: hypothetical protein HYT75_02410 [Deltaproteobacteria bacterium]|nr:hypothetical protein [Deltaproteobacteria bacterium]